MSPDLPSQRPDWTPDAEWARRLHDFTHEVELIISGAVLFGLLQIPGRLDLWFDTLSMRLDGSWWVALFVSWYYVKLIVYTLVASFGLHLLSRAYWVGLVGLDSAFPDGIDWDRIRYGPHSKRVYQERLRSLSEMARRTDRFCSSIFSFAFWTVILFAVSVVIAGCAAVVSLGLGRLIPAMEIQTIWLGIMLMFAVGPLAAVAADRLFGERLEPEGHPARAIRGTLAASFHALGGGLFMPIQFTLFSNVPKKVIWPLYTGVFALLLVLFVGGEAMRGGSLQYAPVAQLPTRPGARSVDARYFADTRAPLGDEPFIQSEVVEGPYVRLELPLVARRDAERILARCADAGAPGATGLVRARATDDPPDAAASERVLACLGDLWIVRLDGETLDVAWDFRSRPALGVTGLVAYLPTATLAAGVHVLEVEEVHVPDSEEDTEEDPELRRHFIRFRT